MKSCRFNGTFEQTFDSKTVLHKQFIVEKTFFSLSMILCYVYTLM